MPSSDIGVAVAKAELNISVYNQPNFVFSWVELSSLINPAQKMAFRLLINKHPDANCRG
jgi:hypothetical protein